MRDAQCAISKVQQNFFSSPSARHCHGKATGFGTPTFLYAHFYRLVYRVAGRIEALADFQNVIHHAKIDCRLIDGSTVESKQNGSCDITKVCPGFSKARC
jgi:hypothetical protein